MDDNTTEFEAFAAAFNDTEDYQIDGAEEVAETETEEDAAEEIGGEGQEEPESGEESEEEHTSDSEEEGADYDRVKNQLAESRQQVQDLQGEQGKYRNAMDVLEAMAAKAEVGLDELVEQLQLNLEMQDGKSESEAKAVIRAQKAEKQLEAMKAETAEKQEPAAEDTPSRATREIAEFQKRFPEVKLTEELCNELAADVQGGMSLIDAYQKRDAAQKDARIAELEKQLQAEKKNKHNRATSPGSQKDSGGKRERSEFDEFAAAFR